MSRQPLTREHPEAIIPDPTAARRVRWSGTGTTPPMILLGGIALFLAILFCPLINQEAMLVRSLLGVACVLFAWLAVLWVRAKGAGTPLRVEFIPVRSHWVQGLVQIVILSYWGAYVSDVGRESPLILAQVLYLTMLDALLSWSRGRSWRLGFGALPIVFSTNLLLWFHHDVYYLQFAMLTVGALGKQFITWEREGRRTHIFNPSVFGQSVVAAALIATGTSNDLTRGQWIASTFEAPHYMILVIFLLGLGVQSLFGVTLMTLGAAATLWVLNLIYTEVTGLYFFVTVNIAATIFLGLHLLITDPSTTPRTNLGKLVFGAMYGLGYFVLFRVLSLMEIPVFWDKLLPVPILNLLAPALDRMARSGVFGRLNGAWHSMLRPKWMNVVHMAVWGTVFGTMMATGFLGGEPNAHPGNSVRFWKEAYAAGKQHAGHSYVMVSGARAEGMGDGAAMNELGVICIDGLGGIVNPSHARAATYFARASALGDLHGSNNVIAQRMFLGESASEQAVLEAFDRLTRACAEEQNPLGCFLVGVVFEFGIGAEGADSGIAPDALRAAAFYTVASRMNARLIPYSAKGLARVLLAGAGAQIDIDPRAVMLVMAQLADQGDGEACWYAAHLTMRGVGVEADASAARSYLDRACAAGLEQACVASDAPFPAYQTPKQLARPGWSTAFPVRAGGDSGDR